MTKRSGGRPDQRRAIARPVSHRALTGVEIAGVAPAESATTGPTTTEPTTTGPAITTADMPGDMSGEPARRDTLWRDAACLVDVARRHAAIVLACPRAERASHLAACRVVWIRYAAALGARSEIQTRFADELQGVTRILMARQQEADGATPITVPEWDPATEKVAPIFTIDDLRPLFQLIIRQ